jgi:hypothetical protein
MNTKYSRCELTRIILAYNNIAFLCYTAMIPAGSMTVGISETWV